MDLLNWYGSVAGICTVTLLVVQGLKKSLADVPWLKNVPVWVYVVLVSVALTLVARDVVGTIEGTRAKLVLDGVTMALMSSGGLEWWRTKGKPLEESTQSGNWLDRMRR